MKLWTDEIHNNTINDLRTEFLKYGKV